MPGVVSPPPAGTAPPPPPEAERIFGDRLALAQRYADLLATTGISHGLVGPREAPRLWERHLVNCAVMHPLLEQDQTVADIGSGAGLPGLALAVVRPDLDVHLVEPLLRRTTWLHSAVEELELDNVVIHRGRAEDVALAVPVVTARAVASLEKLIVWSFPLLPPRGRLLALKGGSAQAELSAASPFLGSLGVTRSALHLVGEGEVSEPVRVVEVVRPESFQRSGGQRPRAKGPGRGSRRRARRRS